MIKTVKCSYCDRKFTGESDDKFGGGRLKANIANHVKAAHPEKYVPSKTAAARSRLLAIPVASITSVNKVGKRGPYYKKPKPLIDVGFCPRCGCNIHAVKVAMGL
jgi:hypothetical protein